MSVDNIGWDESVPANGDFVAEGDDNLRGIKISVSARMRHEHGWPTSQVASNQAGYHTYITLSGQTAAPSLVYGTASTQLAALWCSSGSQNVLIVNSAGTSIVLYNSAANALNIIGAVYSATGTQGDLLIGTSGGAVKPLAAGTDGYILKSRSTTNDAAWIDPNTLISKVIDYGTSASATSTENLSAFKVCRGQVSINADSNISITNLPFASTNSYSIVVSYKDTADFNDGYAGAVQVSGSQATITNQQGSTRVINWIAVGV